MNARLPVPPIWTTGNTEGTKTGTWRSAIAQHIVAPSPCHGACPVDGEIAEWIGRAVARDFRGAWDTLVKHNPFPAIAGRVCHHPCETACNRAGYDQAVSICKLERFIGDAALEQAWPHQPAPEQRAERVAIVGGGPAGLSAAFQLRRLGYAVTLFEAREQLGGVMRYGIPAYRLPRAVLDGEIDRIVALGVTVRCGQAVDTPAALAELRHDFDAVYLATGATRPRRLPLLDYAQPWVLDGADFLARAAAGQVPALGRRVLVVGGGSAAMDVARSARRAGHEVTVLSLEAEAAMPAQREEVVEALEEGVVLADGAMLKSVEHGADGLRLQCVRVELAPTDERGRFEINELAEGGFELLADAIVTSIGQDPDLGWLSDDLPAERSLLQADRQLGTTAAPSVWAGGDLTTMERFVTVAIGSGKRAAWAIDRALRGRSGAAAPADAAAPEAEAEPLVPLAAINLAEHPKRARAPETRLAPALRLAGGQEVQHGLDVEAALREAARCFSCGRCTHCDNCVTYCPDLAVKPLGGGYIVLTDYCKGCGLCVRECPTGSMKMLQEVQ